MILPGVPSRQAEGKYCRPADHQRKAIGMDFQDAALLFGAAFGAVEAVKRVVIPDSWVSKKRDRAILGSALVIGEATTFLVAESDWGPAQIVNGKALAVLNTSSLLLVGVVLALLCVTGHVLLQSVKNIGQNQPDDTPVQ